MARLRTASALLLPLLTTISALQYQLIQDYNASNIFEEFNFFNGSDPTGGFVQYVPFDIAASTRLIGNTSNLIYLGVDTSNIYKPGDVGRPSVRLESKSTFTEGLFVIDLTHIPVGCGTWPSLWTAGLSDWPADGEIDIIENVNDARTNNAAIHATGECSVFNTTEQTGTWKSTDCNILHDDNQGCGTTFTEFANYGAEFNANGGGVYVMEWTSSFIKIWFFPASSVPASLLNGAVPDTTLFGTLSASFGGPCSEYFGEKFFNHSIVIDTTFCGGWAGGTFGTGSSSCPLKEGLNSTESCVDYVANNPGAFKEAYWGIRSIQVWEKVQDYTLPGLTTPGIALPTPAIVPADALTETLILASNVIPTSTAAFPPVLTDVLFPAGPKGATLGSISMTGAGVIDNPPNESAPVTVSIPVSPDVPTAAFEVSSAIIPAGTEDVLIEPTALSKPSAIYEPLQISPLTGGALTVGHGSPNAATGAKGDITEEDHSGLDEPGVANTVASLAGLVGGVSHGNAPPKILDTGSSTTDTKKVGGPLPPSPSLRLPKGKKNGHTLLLSPSRLQTLTPSLDAVLNIPSTESPANLIIPDLTGGVPGSEGTVFGITQVDPSSIAPRPIETEIASFEPLQHSNSLLPANGNAGVIPPVINKSPILTLWDSLDNELKGQLIAAATKLPALPPGSDFLNELWVSLDPILQGRILQSAKNLLWTPSDSLSPKISDLVAAWSGGKIPSAPLVQVSPSVKTTGNGLLGFLDAATKEKLKAALATVASNSDKENGRRRRQVVSVVRPLASTNNAAASIPPASNVISTVPQAPPLNLSLTPNVPMTALTNTDTAQAMNGLLSFLDDSTKAQIAGLLLADDTSTADMSQAHKRWRPTNEDKTWDTENQIQTWNQVKTNLLDDTIIKLDAIIKEVAALDGPGPSLVKSNSILDVANPQAVEALTEAIDSIDINDRYKIAEFLTSNKEIFNQIGPLISLLLYNDGTTPATGLQDIVNAANNYAASPNDDTLEVFMEVLQDSTYSIYGDTTAATPPITKRGGTLQARQATSNWTPQDKLALAQNVYTLCPTAAVLGIPFPSANDLATDLLNPNKTLEEAAAAFQRKLQAYFDVTVQGCWSKINQWLAWRQLLRRPNGAYALPFPGVKPLRMAVRQEDESSDYSVSDKDAQGFLEQQIYAICPKPNTLSTDNLIADLEDDTISIDEAIGNFQNKLWAYMAKLQSCSDKIRSYGPQLKALVSSSGEPVYHTTDDAPEKRRARRQIPNLAGLSPVEILNLLDQLKQTGQSYADLAPEDQKGVYDALIGGFTQGQEVDPHTLDQLQNLAIGLTQATLPLPPSLTGLGGDTGVRSQNPTTPNGPEPNPGNGGEPPSDGGDDVGDDIGDDVGDDDGIGGDGVDDSGDDSSGDIPGDDSGEIGDDDGSGSDDGSFGGASDDSDPGDDFENGGSDDSSGDGGPTDSDDGDAGTEPEDDGEGMAEPGDDGEGSFEPGDDGDDGGFEPGDDDGGGSAEPGDNGEGSIEPGDDQTDTGDDSGSVGEDSGDQEDQGPPSDDTNEDAGDQNDIAVGEGSGDDTGDRSEPESGDVEAGPDDGGEDIPVGDDPSVNDPFRDGDTNDTPDDTPAGGDGVDDASPSDDFPDATDGDIEGGNEPDLDEESPLPRFFSRILRSLPQRKRQVSSDANGVIPDTDVPADLDKILGQYGTLDPYGSLGPQIGSADETADATDPHDSPNVADDEDFELPDSAVDEPSPEVDQILEKGGLDPFGQAEQSRNIEADEDPADDLDSQTYLDKLRAYDHGGGNKDLGDPRDVEDFVNKFLNNGSV